MLPYFTKDGEEFVNLLISIGMREQDAMVLTFLASRSESTFQEIEEGISLRPADATTAIKYPDGSGLDQKP